MGVANLGRVSRGDPSGVRPAIPRAAGGLGVPARDRLLHQPALRGRLRLNRHRLGVRPPRRRPPSRARGVLALARSQGGPADLAGRGSRLAPRDGRLHSCRSPEARPRNSLCLLRRTGAWAVGGGDRGGRGRRAPGDFGRVGAAAATALRGPDDAPLVPARDARGPVALRGPFRPGSRWTVRAGASPARLDPGAVEGLAKRPAPGRGPRLAHRLGPQRDRDPVDWPGFRPAFEAAPGAVGRAVPGLAIGGGRCGGTPGAGRLVRARPTLDAGRFAGE